MNIKKSRSPNGFLLFVCAGDGNTGSKKAGGGRPLIGVLYQARVTLPERRQRVQTFILLTSPSTTTRTL